MDLLNFLYFDRNFFLNFKINEKDFQKEIQAFEETAAPAGHSLLWDDTDKTYGYVNNYTGEVTFKYPTTYQKPKKVLTKQFYLYLKIYRKIYFWHFVFF